MTWSAAATSCAGTVRPIICAVCLATEPADELKRRDRGLRLLARRLSGAEPGDDVDSEQEAGGLSEELIDYHAQYRPLELANVIFDNIDAC
jgi:hypothetical protein